MAVDLDSVEWTVTPTNHPLLSNTNSFLEDRVVEIDAQPHIIERSVGTESTIDCDVSLTSLLHLSDFAVRGVPVEFGSSGSTNDINAVVKLLKSGKRGKNANGS